MARRYARLREALRDAASRSSSTRNSCPKLQDALLDAQFSCVKSQSHGRRDDRHGIPTGRPQRGRQRDARLARSQVREGVRLWRANADERERPVLWRYWLDCRKRAASPSFTRAGTSELLRDAVKQDGTARAWGDGLRRAAERIR
jgi:hypothetical protein